MVLRSCQCLNVRANVIEKAGHDGAAFVQVDLGVGGIKVMHPKLLSIRPHGSQKVLHCGNCSLDVIIYEPKNANGNKDPFGGDDEDRNEELKKIFEHKGSILLNQNCLTEKGISEAKLKDNYSEVFYIILNDELSNKKNSLTELQLDKEYHDTLLALHNQVTVEFTKRKKDLKERVRRFEEEQIKEYNAQQARAHLDRQKLWNTICVVNQESLTFKKRTQSVPQPVKYGEDPLTGFNEQRMRREREPLQSGPASSPMQARDQSKSGRSEARNEEKPAAQPKEHRPVAASPVQQPASSPAGPSAIPQGSSVLKSPPRASKQEGTDGGKSPKKITGEPNKGKAKTKGAPETLFQLEGFEDEEEDDQDDQGQDTVEDEEEEDEESEEEPEESKEPLHNLYSTSVPVSIPARSFVPIQLDPLEEVGEEFQSEPFEAPHVFLAKSYAADSREIFGERPRKMNFSLGI